MWQSAADARGLGQRLAYNKGLLVWDMLSRQIGRRKCAFVMKGIASRYAFQDLGWDELKRAIESGSGMDLKWLFEQWFERASAPDWSLDWKQERVVCAPRSPKLRHIFKRC